MHFAAPKLLPLGMPAGMKRKPHTTLFHPVNYRPLPWRVTLFLPRNPLGTGPQDFDQALVWQLFPLMAKILAGYIERINTQLFGEPVDEATHNQVQLAVTDAAHH